MTILQNRKYLILILVITSALIAKSFTHRVFVSDALSTLTVLAVLSVVFKGWRERTVAFAMAAASTAVDWSHYLYLLDEHQLLNAVAYHGLMALFFGFTVAVILRNIFADTAITGDKVFGAVCGYLLAAGMWADVYALTELLVPESFETSSQLARELSSWHGRTALFDYFSLVTLTTMGYGDVTPVRPPATVLATLEAIFGQFYIAVVVAALVGLRLAQAIRLKDPPLH